METTPTKAYRIYSHIPGVHRDNYIEYDIRTKMQGHDLPDSFWHVSSMGRIRGAYRDLRNRGLDARNARYTVFSVAFGANLAHSQRFGVRSSDKKYEEI